MQTTKLIRFQNKEYKHDRFDMAIIEQQHRTSGIKEAMAVKLEMKELQSEAEAIQPILTLTRMEMQGLMDNLWELGLRPTDAGSVDGELKATRAHLADIRDMHSALLRKALGINDEVMGIDMVAMNKNSAGRTRGPNVPVNTQNPTHPSNP